MASELAPAAEGALLLSALLLSTPQRRALYLLLALTAHFAAGSAAGAQGEVLVRFAANAVAALCGALPLWRLDRSRQSLDNVHSVSLLMVFGALIGPLMAVLLEAQRTPVGALALLLRAFAVLAVVPWVVNGTRQLRDRSDPLPAHQRRAGLGVVAASAAALLIGSVALGANPDPASLWLVSFNTLLACTLPLIAVLISERRHAQGELDIADARFQAVFEHHVLPMALWRKGSPILKANRAFLRLAGPNAEAHRPTLLVGGSAVALDEPLPDLDATEGDPLTRFSQSKTMLQLDDGRNVPVVLGRYFADGGCEGIIHALDLNAFREPESRRQECLQLAHLGRVALLGQLSGALAHELNQPLTSILGNAETALRLLGSATAAGELDEILHDIIDEDLRAAHVIQRLRALLDKGESIREPVNLNTSVHEVLGLCRSELVARNVNVRIDLDDTLPDVMADRVQMQQIVLNLLMNACDAVANCPVAERTVALATRVGGNAPGTEPLSVQLSVSDNGPGVPGTGLEHIFRPFVSSKPHGMGLGLAICRAIAESHRGRLWAANLASVGAVFHLVLPAGGASS